MNTLTLNQAAEFLKIHPQTLRARALSGELPGAKIGKSWVFIEEDLAAVIRSRYSDLGWASHSKGEQQCYTDDQTAKFGVVDLHHQTASKYEELLKLPTKRRH
jgi:excisionase family DNA binding protein